MRAIMMASGIGRLDRFTSDASLAATRGQQRSRPNDAALSRARRRMRAGQKKAGSTHFVVASISAMTYSLSTNAETRDDRTASMDR